MNVLRIFGHRTTTESVAEAKPAEKPIDLQVAMVKRSALPEESELSSTQEIKNPVPLDEEEKSEGLVDRICSYVKSIFYSQFQGKSSRSAKAINKAMQEIGGAPIKMKTSKGMKLRGMHFTADALMKKVTEAGAEKVTVTSQASGKEYSAMVLDPKAKGVEKLLKNFEELGFTKKVRKSSSDGVRNDVCEGIWEKKTIDGKIYLFKKDELAEMRREKIFSQKGSINSDKARVSTPTLFSHVDGAKRKTYVLNGGVYSRFKSNYIAQRVAKLLSLGFDVVVSDDKDKIAGDGESKSKVTASRDAIYNYLQQRGVENDDIVWMGICQSAVPAAEAAARYPGSHAWIEQGYYNSDDVVANNAPLANGVMGAAVGPTAAYVAYLADFYFSMEEALANVKGDVLLVRNDNDEVIEEVHHQRMRERLNQAGNLFASFHISDERVEHAGNCFIDLQCAAKIENHLNAKGWTSGALIV